MHFKQLSIVNTYNKLNINKNKNLLGQLESLMLESIWQQSNVFSLFIISVPEQGSCNLIWLGRAGLQETYLFLVILTRILF